MFEFAIVVLFVLAISDLVVGVSNDAVNFLNSSIGSKVATRRVIMIIASLGMLAGVTFSSGMMEVARKGIFNPQFFTGYGIVGIHQSRIVKIVGNRKGRFEIIPRYQDHIMHNGNRVICIDDHIIKNRHHGH